MKLFHIAKVRAQSRVEPGPDPIVQRVRGALEWASMGLVQLLNNDYGKAVLAQPMLSLRVCRCRHASAVAPSYSNQEHRHVAGPNWRVFTVPL